MDHVFGTEPHAVVTEADGDTFLSERTPMAIAPPSGEYFTALVNRLPITWRKRGSSQYPSTCAADRSVSRWRSDVAWTPAINALTSETRSMWDGRAADPPQSASGQAGGRLVDVVTALARGCVSIAWCAALYAEHP